MAIFRDYTPERRNITTIVAKYNDHKEDLQIDFKKRCGYCNSPDSWKLTYYEIDHFIPEHILTIKSNTDYSNLIYACRSCNNSKRKKWPTNDENIPNANDEGWVDPCNKTYNSHFSRRPDGTIMFETNLGKWMYTSLKLHKPQHQVVYNLEQLDTLIKELEDLNSTVKNDVITTLLLNTYRNYKTYIDRFRDL